MTAPDIRRSQGRNQAGIGLASAPIRARGRVRADLVYLGWREVLTEDPGPPPVAPRPPVLDEVSSDWVAAQRREQSRLTRPARLTLAAGLLMTGLAGLTWLSKPPQGALPGGLAALLAVSGGGLAAVGGRGVFGAARSLAAQLRGEEHRVAAFRAVQCSQHAARQEEHARRYQDWQTAAARHRPLWYPVTLPATVHRLDVAGGTLAGWSALLTMIAAPRLAAGGAVTVIDLTEGAVAADLLAVARQSGLDPLVWVLPADLPRLELGADFEAGLLADVLAQTVSAAGWAGGAATGRAEAGANQAGANQARDAALLRRVLSAVGEGASMAQLIAALRILGQLGAPADHLESGALTRPQLARLAAMTGRAAGHLVVDRVWAMEERLQVLAPLAAELASRPPSRLKVAWLDRRASVVGNGVLAAYLSAALTAALRQAPTAPRWQQTLCLLGAERLPGDLLDRLCDACEVAGAGLVLAYRSIPPQVRLGRGDAAVGFMRLGNAEDARLAAEQIGSRHRFVVSQLTDTVGASLTDTAGGSYTSTVGSSDSVSLSGSVTQSAGRSSGRSQTRHSSFAPFADFTGSASRDASESTATSDSTSITAGISTSTSWGWTTSRAIGASDSLARTAQRSRELLVEQHELQQLPPSAVLLWYPAPGGHQVVLADANPAIITLPTATLALE